MSNTADSSASSLPQSPVLSNVSDSHHENKTNEENNGDDLPLVNIPYPSKIVVHFRPVGSAPILKQKKFKVASDKLFLSLTNFLKSQLKLSAEDKIYIYCNQVFEPSFDERLGDLYTCFKVGKELVFYYSLVPAWA
mmetsp:Transcript_28833/g.47244  ORF Transcript_28833/g.47244 Transcript_28833/m.47244 type:complete len:136 (+) Transcript_28833:27-434(+)